MQIMINYYSPSSLNVSKSLRRKESSRCRRQRQSLKDFHEKLPNEISFVCVFFFDSTSSIFSNRKDKHAFYLMSQQMISFVSSFLASGQLCYRVPLHLLKLIRIKMKTRFRRSRFEMCNLNKKCEPTTDCNNKYNFVADDANIK